MRSSYQNRAGKLIRAINPTPYKASIDDDELGIFISAGWTKAASVNENTEEHLIKCVKDRCVREVIGEELHLVHNAVKQVEIKMNTEDHEDRIWSLHRDFFFALEIARHGD